jgi:hypothetical protein
VKAFQTFAKANRDYDRGSDLPRAPRSSWVRHSITRAQPRQDALLDAGVERGLRRPCRQRT